MKGNDGIRAREDGFLAGSSHGSPAAFLERVKVGACTSWRGLFVLPRCWSRSTAPRAWSHTSVSAV